MDANCRDRKGRTPLSLAAGWGCQEIMPGVDINFKSWTPLYLAVVHRRQSILWQCLQVVGVGGSVSLDSALGCRQKNIVCQVLRVADVTVYNDRTPTPLAAERDYNGVMKKLLGVDASYSDNEDQPLSHPTTEYQHETIARQLLQVLDANCTNVRAPPPLVVEKEYQQIVEQLLEVQDVDVNCRDNEGWAPLHLAAAYNLETVLRRLLQVAGINVNLESKNG